MSRNPGAFFTGRALIALWLLTCAAPGFGGESSRHVWTWHAGDNPEWAAGAFDDTDWPRGELPEALPLWRNPHRGWYRLYFTLPEEAPPAGWGVALGRILTADEVFLNGEYLGGTGVLEDPFVDVLYHRRVYPLPTPLLRPGTNVLAIRVQSSLAEGGLSGNQPRFGDYADLTRANEALNQRRHLIEVFFLGMLSVALVLWLLLMISQAHQTEFIYLGSLSALLSGIVLLESHLWYDAGLASPFSQRMIVALILWTPSPLLMFGARLYPGQGPPRLHYAGVGVSMAAGAFFLVFGTVRLCHPMETGWWLLLVFTCGLLARDAWRLRIWRQALAPLTVAAGITLMIVLVLLEVFLPGGRSRFPPVGVLLYTGFGVMILALAAAMALRIRDMNQRLRALSHQMVTAQETACQRTADALHNELAPTLAAAKLELQLFLNQHQADEAGARVVDQLALAIEQVRSLSHEMHPSAVDQLGLAASLQALAERLAAAHDWNLHVSLENQTGLSAAKAVFLYRMGQELLYNIVKHARASDVTVILTGNPEGAQLVVRDNGGGCNLKHTPPGIGWYTLCERTEALRGRCRINTKPGCGLEVTLWIPRV